MSGNTVAIVLILSALVVLEYHVRVGLWRKPAVDSPASLSASTHGSYFGVSAQAVPSARVPTHSWDDESAIEGAAATTPDPATPTESSVDTNESAETTGDHLEDPQEYERLVAYLRFFPSVYPDSLVKAQEKACEMCTIAENRIRHSLHKARESLSSAEAAAFWLCDHVSGASNMEALCRYHFHQIVPFLLQGAVQGPAADLVCPSLPICMDFDLERLRAATVALEARRDAATRS